MPLQSSYLTEGLSQAQANSLGKITDTISLGAGEWIFREGEEAHHFFVLREGTVEFLLEMGEVEIPVRVLSNAGECFGTSALDQPNIYSISARARTAVSLARIGEQQFRELTDQDRELGLALMGNIARHLLRRVTESRQELKVHFRSLLRLSQFIH